VSKILERRDNFQGLPVGRELTVQGFPAGLDGSPLPLALRCRYAQVRVAVASVKGIRSREHTTVITAGRWRTIFSDLKYYANVSIREVAA
jgi:hypothetical protein